MKHLLPILCLFGFLLSNSENSKKIKEHSVGVSYNVCNGEYGTLFESYTDRNESSAISIFYAKEFNNGMKMKPVIKVFYDSISSDNFYSDIYLQNIGLGVMHKFNFLNNKLFFAYGISAGYSKIVTTDYNVYHWNGSEGYTYNDIYRYSGTILRPEIELSYYFVENFGLYFNLNETFSDIILLNSPDFDWYEISTIKYTLFEIGLIYRF